VLWLALALTGAATAYLAFLRPVLKAIPALKQFYAEADSFWAKGKAVCWKSLTVAWSYLVLAVGFGLNWLDPVATALGDPELKAQVANALQTNPKILGYVLIGISVVTIVSRLRSIGKA
jgi:hypothetical protein